MAPTLHAPRPASPPDVALRRLLRFGAAARLFATYWGCLVVVDLTGRGAATEAGIAVLVAACSLHQRVTTALAAAGIGWLFVVGFVVNGSGELALHGPVDVVRLVLLAAVAVLAAATTRNGTTR